jgi:hypothetical protein
MLLGSALLDVGKLCPNLQKLDVRYCSRVSAAHLLTIPVGCEIWPLHLRPRMMTPSLAAAMPVESSTSKSTSTDQQHQSTATTASRPPSPVSSGAAPQGPGDGGADLTLRDLIESIIRAHY